MQNLIHSEQSPIVSFSSPNGNASEKVATLRPNTAKNLDMYSQQLCSVFTSAKPLLPKCRRVRSANLHTLRVQFRQNTIKFTPLL